LTIENSRSDDEMVRALAKYAYNRDLGPGIYDVHSPAVPTVDFMAEKIRAFLATGVLGGDPWRLWVNPDCTLWLLQAPYEQQRCFAVVASLFCSYRMHILFFLTARRWPQDT
jgi:methionine synthase II (cobalamin-independent)